MKTHGRVDENQKQIVAALRKCGCSVVSLASIGNGCPDILVGVAGRNVLLEIKNPEQDASHRKLKPLEAKFFESWRGQCAVVHTIDGALEAVGIK